MLIYNTLTQQKEEFIPITPNTVNMYVCGITAYDYCHIGHARSAIVFDIIVRQLRHKGFNVNFVRNFTDVDDKIIVKARKELPDAPNMKDACISISEKYIEAFHEDMDKLGVIRADKEPKATEYIDEMISIAKRLIDNGKAYSTPSGDVYFRVHSFDTYGELSKRSLESMQAGARIAPGEEKEDPLDFALWKGSKPNEPAWDSPWGLGRPGWHIECSAMSEKNLPLPLDIHGGGQDLIFPHHENEIAQTEASTGKCLAKYWVHNGFVQINSEKMSKSLNNFATIRDTLNTYLPEVVRFFLLTKHYRSPIDFTADGLIEIEKNLKRIYETLHQINLLTDRPENSIVKDIEPLKKELIAIKENWESAMDDDFNTAAALGFVNNIISIANKILENKNHKKDCNLHDLLQDILVTIQKWSNVLGVLSLDPKTFLEDLKQIKIKRSNIDSFLVETLLKKRNEAKKNKNFEEADSLRDQIKDLGVSIKDTPEGTLWDVE